MKIYKNLLWAACFIAASASAQIPNSFNFKYMADGQRSIMPIQVFDDGKETIFQYKPNQPIPAIFVDQEGSWQLVQPRVEGSYLYIPLTSAQFKLKLGYKEGIVRYIGYDRSKTIPDSAVNHLTKRSYTAKAKGDDYTWVENSEFLENSVVFIKGTAKVTLNTTKNFVKIANNLKGANSINVVGYANTEDEPGLSQSRVDAIVNSLTAFGIERTAIKTNVKFTGVSEVNGGEVGARIEYVKGLAVTEPLLQPVKLYKAVPNTDWIDSTNQASEVSSSDKQLYRIEVSDTTILEVIKRWGRDSKWTVISLNFPHIPLEHSQSQVITYGTFLEAVSKMEQGLKDKGYKAVESFAYTNNVLEVGVK